MRNRVLLKMLVPAVFLAIGPFGRAVAAESPPPRALHPPGG